MIIVKNKNNNNKSLQEYSVFKILQQQNLSSQKQPCTTVVKWHINNVSSVSKLPLIVLNINPSESRNRSHYMLRISATRNPSPITGKTRVENCSNSFRYPPHSSTVCNLKQFQNFHILVMLGNSQNVTAHRTCWPELIFKLLNLMT